MTTLTTEELATITLKSGSHATREEGVCAMEAVAWLAGEPHSAAPKCASPVIGGFLRSWNDALTTDESRQRLLLPLLPLAVSTRADDDTELMRSYMALDWLIRVHGATWLQLAGLDDYAKALSGLDELDSPMAVEKAVPLLDAAREVAEAAGEAAWEAARAAAWAAAWEAAGEAAGETAGEAARTAAWAAAWEAAGGQLGMQPGTREAAWDATRESSLGCSQGGSRESSLGCSQGGSGPHCCGAAGQCAGPGAAHGSGQVTTQIPMLERPVSAGELVLRPYQAWSVDELARAKRDGNLWTILCSPTGSGKTEIAIHLIDRARKRGMRVAFVCDRRTLVKQTSDRFAAYGIPHGVAMAEKTFGRSMPIQICSAQTIEKRGYWPALDLLGIDEAHTQRKGVLEFAKAWGGPVIGLTATPLTKRLGQWYSKVINAVTTDRLLQDGYLAPLKMYAATEIDMTGAKKGNDGEWLRSEVRTRGRKIIGEIPSTWERMTRQHFGGPVKTLLFSADVAHGEELCRAFQAAGHDFPPVHLPRLRGQHRGDGSGFQAQRIPGTGVGGQVREGRGLPRRALHSGGAALLLGTGVALARYG